MAPRYCRPLNLKQTTYYNYYKRLMSANPRNDKTLAKSATPTTGAADFFCQSILRQPNKPKTANKWS
jgi:hypothetical protein